MIARGKREARRPWLVHLKEGRGLEGRNTHRITPLQGWAQFFIFVTRGDALRACPWLSYAAPLALFGLI